MKTRRTRLIVLGCLAGLLIGLAALDLITGPRWGPAIVKLGFAAFAIYGFTGLMTRRRV